MSLPAKTGLSLALKLKNDYQSMGGGEESRFYTIFDPGFLDAVVERPILTGETLIFSWYNNVAANANGVLESSSDASSYVQVGADGLTITLLGFAGTLNGSTIVSGTTQLTIGAINAFVLTATVDTNFLYAGTDLTNDSGGIIFDIAGPNFDIPLDTDSLTVARETLSADGEELLSNIAGDWTTSGDVTSLGDRAFSFDASDTSFIYAEYNYTFEVGKAYKVYISPRDYVSGEISVSTVGVTTEAVLTNYDPSSGDIYVIYAPTVSNTAFRVFRGFGTIAVFNVTVSLKETTDALYIDVQSEDKVQELP